MNLFNIKLNKKKPELLKMYFLNLISLKNNDQ